MKIIKWVLLIFFIVAVFLVGWGFRLILSLSATAIVPILTANPLYYLAFLLISAVLSILALTLYSFESDGLEKWGRLVSFPFVCVLVFFMVGVFYYANLVGSFYGNAFWSSKANQDTMLAFLFVFPALFLINPVFMMVDFVIVLRKKLPLSLNWKRKLTISLDVLFLAGLFLAFQFFQFYQRLQPRFPWTGEYHCTSQYCTYPAKPVIYLYPTHTQDVTVQLHYQGTLAATYPAYDSTISGWSVTASPDGTLVNHADDKQYSYLFWEGNPTNTHYNLSTGFVVKGSDTASFLQAVLPKLGLTPKEYNEFIVYWYPKMKDNPYNLIHFAGKSYTDIAPLTITPAPDSLLRVFMVYKPLQEPIVVQPESITPFQRKGFTVVEWGGTEVE